MGNGEINNYIVIKIQPFSAQLELLVACSVLNTDEFFEY